MSMEIWVQYSRTLVKKPDRVPVIDPSEVVTGRSLKLASQSRQMGELQIQPETLSLKTRWRVA